MSSTQYNYNLAEYEFSPQDMLLTSNQFDYNDTKYEIYELDQSYKKINNLKLYQLFNDQQKYTFKKYNQNENILMNKTRSIYLYTSKPFMLRKYSIKFSSSTNYKFEFNAYGSNEQIIWTKLNKSTFNSDFSSGYYENFTYNTDMQFNYFKIELIPLSVPSIITINCIKMFFSHPVKSTESSEQTISNLSSDSSALHFGIKNNQKNFSITNTLSKLYDNILSNNLSFNAFDQTQQNDLAKSEILRLSLNNKKPSVCIGTSESENNTLKVNGGISLDWINNQNIQNPKNQQVKIDETVMSALNKIMPDYLETIQLAVQYNILTINQLKQSIDAINSGYITLDSLKQLLNETKPKIAIIQESLNNNTNLLKQTTDIYPIKQTYIGITNKSNGENLMNNFNGLIFKSDLNKNINTISIGITSPNKSNTDNQNIDSNLTNSNLTKEAIKITSNGNIGIGCSNPIYPLDIKCNYDADDFTKYFKNPPTVNNNPSTVNNNLNTTPPICINTNGAIISDYGYISKADKRSIKNYYLMPTTLPLYQVSKLKLTSFNYLADRDVSSTFDMGFFIDDIEKNIPNAITQISDYIPKPYKMYKYTQSAQFTQHNQSAQTAQTTLSAQFTQHNQSDQPTQTDPILQIDTSINPHKIILTLFNVDSDEQIFINQIYKYVTNEKENKKIRAKLFLNYGTITKEVFADCDIDINVKTKQITYPVKITFNLIEQLHTTEKLLQIFVWGYLVDDFKTIDTDYIYNTGIASIQNLINSNYSFFEINYTDTENFNKWTNDMIGSIVYFGTKQTETLKIATIKIPLINFQHNFPTLSDKTYYLVITIDGSINKNAIITTNFTNSITSIYETVKSLSNNKRTFTTVGSDQMAYIIKHIDQKDILFDVFVEYNGNIKSVEVRDSFDNVLAYNGSDKPYVNYFDQNYTKKTYELWNYDSSKEIKGSFYGNIVYNNLIKQINNKPLNQSNMTFYDYNSKTKLFDLSNKSDIQFASETNLPYISSLESIVKENTTPTSSLTHTSLFAEKNSINNINNIYYKKDSSLFTNNSDLNLPDANIDKQINTVHNLNQTQFIDLGFDNNYLGAMYDIVTVPYGCASNEVEKKILIIKTKGTVSLLYYIQDMNSLSLKYGDLLTTCSLKGFVVLQQNSTINYLDKYTLNNKTIAKCMVNVSFNPNAIGKFTKIECLLI
jgi:hypothetical protein